MCGDDGQGRLGRCGLALGTGYPDALEDVSCGQASRKAPVQAGDLYPSGQRERLCPTWPSTYSFRLATAVISVITAASQRYVLGCP